MAILSALRGLSSRFNKLSQIEYKQRSTESIQWFQNRIVNEFLFQSRNKNAQWVYDESGNQKRKLGGVEIHRGIEVGSMYLYIYDAKTKAKLPYWDAFPLVLPIQPYKDGFLGLNFHYLPPNLRLIMLNQLLSATEGVRSKAAYMNLSYAILKTATKSKYYKPTIKRYLYGHVRSQFAYINPNEWEKAVMLPISKFQKASKQDVWADSVESNQ